MTQLPLHIRYGTTAQREPVAWFILGDDPRAWLSEIASWPVAHSSLSLLVVPRSRQDLHPCGVLVIGPLAQLPRPSHCHPYGRVAERFHLPVEAELAPDVSDAELLALLASDRQYVFHPIAGLCSFAPDEVLTAANLLTVPEPLPRLWDRAQPGIALARRLTALTPEETPTVEQVLQAGRGDIGTSAHHLDELPPSTDEPAGDLVSRAGRGIKHGLAKFVDWLTSFAPGNSERPTWVDKVRGWARQQLDHIHDAWNKERNREILRLMDLLEKDPDRALKYALPVGGEAHRGLAPPSNRLGARDPNFNLSRIGGCGPADFWDLPNEYRQQLVARYRDLANRELRLGQYRRAAYIFAELLADLQAAATALTAGRHWREAAVLYRDKLKRPHDAARCLEQGGLWTEAVALYESLQEHEKAGDLLRKLEQEEPARSAYRNETGKLLTRGDFLGMARVLFEKLQEADEALVRLDEGWPGSPQAQGCLRESFRLRGLLGRHDDSRQRIEILRRDGVSPDAIAPLVEVLAETATGYPDRGLRDLAADQARLWTSDRLQDAAPDIARRLLNAVERLTPEDLLLPRDSRRFLEQRSRKPSPVLRQRIRLRLLDRIELPPGIA